MFKFWFQRTVIDTEPCLLDILDTAGQVEFTAMREQYMRCGEGFIICYSITDRHSFIEAEEYRNLILKVNNYLLNYSYTTMVLLKTLLNPFKNSHCSNSCM